MLAVTGMPTQNIKPMTPEETIAYCPLMVVLLIFLAWVTGWIWREMWREKFLDWGLIVFPAIMWICMALATLSAYLNAISLIER